jgi:hypothetical protein
MALTPGHRQRSGLAWNSQRVSQTLSVPGRFNGPLTSGHGGYCSGVIAGFVEGPAEVTLRSPVPLDTRLDVAPEDDGSIRVLDGETLVAEAHSAPELELEVPSPVGVEAARQASTRYRGRSDGLFGRCFVCGRGRDDALGVFAGSVDGRGLVASPWTPAPWTAGDSGQVLPEFIWAVMDCPTYFAIYRETRPLSFLGRMIARIDAPVAVGAEHVVIAWPISADGRKHQAGAAVLSADGEVLAAARALMIEPRGGGAE